MILLYFMFA